MQTEESDKPFVVTAHLLRAAKALTMPLSLHCWLYLVVFSAWPLAKLVCLFPALHSYSSHLLTLDCISAHSFSPSISDFYRVRTVKNWNKLED